MLMSLGQVCGPLWSDLIGWKSLYRFTVGRCQLIPPGKSSWSPMTKDVSKYIGSFEIDGRWIAGTLKGLSLFGFSASHDGVNPFFSHFNKHHAKSHE